ncbi:mechanosensitive ion channel [Candidatus Woesearchaeota archaeon]|nr:mechanosensitive ion channel [Candidatus Woesearchaeota archaeon]
MADTVNQSLEMIDGVSNAFSPLISNIVVAVLILLLGLIIGKLSGNLVRRALNEVQLDKSLRSAVKIKFSVEKAIGSLVSYMIYFVAVILSLNKLGLTAAIITILAFIIVLIITISFLLTVRDFFPNLLGGMRIKNGMFSEGDEIQIREVKGKVISSGFLETRIMTPYKEEVIIPNSVFNKRQVIVRRKPQKNKDRQASQ